MKISGIWRSYGQKYRYGGPIFSGHSVLGLSVVYVLCLWQALGVFGLCQIHAFIDYVHSRLTREQFHILFRGLVLFAAVAGLSSFGIATFLGSILYYLLLYVMQWFWITLGLTDFCCQNCQKKSTLRAHLALLFMFILCCSNLHLSLIHI